MAQGLQGVPGISPSSKQGETVQQHLDVVSYFFCSLSTTFRKLKWSQLQRSEQLDPPGTWSCLGQHAWEELSEERLS